MYLIKELSINSLCVYPQNTVIILVTIKSTTQKLSENFTLHQKISNFIEVPLHLISSLMAGNNWSFPKLPESSDSPATWQAIGK